MKECRKCYESKELEQFSLNKTSKDGRLNMCKLCGALYMKELYKKSPELIKSRTDKYRKENPERHKSTNLKYRELNLEKSLSDGKKWRTKNIDHVRVHRREYYRTHKAKAFSQNAGKRSQKRKATNKERKQELEQIYKQAEALNCNGVIVHVDHIIPLNHPDVCGLHTPDNLQILTKEDNLYKSNKFDGTYENETWKLSSTLANSVLDSSSNLIETPLI